MPEYEPLLIYTFFRHIFYTPVKYLKLFVYVFVSPSATIDYVEILVSSIPRCL
jgi:hypothetical protein